MASPRIVLVYASTNGQTAKIMKHLSATLQKKGLEAELYDVRTSKPDLAGANAIVVGASLLYGHYQPEIVELARANVAALTAAEAIFLPVSVSAARDTDGSKREVQRSIEKFAEKTKWTPARAIPTGGALRWTQYSFFTKLQLLLVMKLLRAKETNTKRDYELTDWAAVDALAAELVARVAPAAAA